MRLTTISLLLVLFYNLSGQNSFYTSFGSPDQTYTEACDALVTAGNKVYALSTQRKPGDKFLLVIYQVDPLTGVFLDSTLLPQETHRNIIDAAGNDEGEIFVIHGHRWKDRQVMLFDTKKKTFRQQALAYPENFTFDQLWSEGKGRWVIGAKAVNKQPGYQLLQFSDLEVTNKLHLFPDSKVMINDLIKLPNSDRLLVGSLRDSAALIWLAGDTVNRVITYGKATDKYKVELEYDAFRKVLHHDETNTSITGGYEGMGNEVIIDMDHNYQVLRDTISKGSHPNQVSVVEHVPNGRRFYSFNNYRLSVTDRNQEPIYFHSIGMRGKVPRPTWTTNDICLSPDGKVLITAGSSGRPEKDLNFTLTGYSPDLKDTIWHREVGLTGMNTSYAPEGIAANKDGTIFSLVRRPADAGHHELILQADDKPVGNLWRVRVAMFPEDTPEDAVLSMDRNGQLLVMGAIPGKEASWLYRYNQAGTLLGQTETPRTSHFSVKPRLQELQDGRLLATMSVPFIHGSFDPSDALAKGYSATDYLSRYPCLLVMTPDGKTSRIDTLHELRKGRVTDVVELKNNELIVSGYSLKPLHAGISRYSLTTRSRTWARSLHRPGFEWSRVRSVSAARNKKYYDVLCEYQRDKGKDTDLMIYRFNDKNQMVDSLLIEHRDRHLFGAELHRTAKGDLLLRYGLGKPPFDYANDDERLRLVLISGKRLKILKTKYYDEFQGTTIPYHSTAFGKKGHAVLGTMLVDGERSLDTFLFRLGAAEWD